MSLPTTEAWCASDIAQRHPGWLVWTSRPIATRAATGRPPLDDGVWAATVIADDWAELEAKLAEQDANDAAQARE